MLDESAGIPLECKGERRGSWENSGENRLFMPLPFPSREHLLSNDKLSEPGYYWMRQFAFQNFLFLI